MKLSDDLPKWVALPLRVFLYALVIYILVNVAAGVLRGRVMIHEEECSNRVTMSEGGLKYAKAMVSCIREKNGVLENWLMGSLYRAIDGMNVQKQFVGVWEAAQPRCNFRHRLLENGEFFSEPIGCSISGESFHGTWGIYDNQMIWLSDEGRVWPPDINPMDVVDTNFFLLKEVDGSRTRFTRLADVKEETTAANIHSVVVEDAGVSVGEETKPSLVVETSNAMPPESGEDVIEGEDAVFKPKFDASNPQAPLEAAVLYEGVVLPVLSIPSIHQQFLAQTELDLTGVEGRKLTNCDAFPGCQVTATLIAKHNRMNSIPEKWFDAGGNVYATADGIYFMSDIGIISGFKLRRSDKELGRTRNRALLNRVDGFADMRNLNPKEWQGWPEFHRELQEWSKQQDARCKAAVECKQAINWLSSVGNFQGEAREFKLADGRTLSLLQANAHSQGAGVLVHKPEHAGEYTPPDSLTVNLWRLTQTDGSVKVLRIRNMEWLSEMAASTLNYPYCETQCGPSWTDWPQVISADGHTYVFGEYSGGTVSGFLFFEMLPTELRFLKWYRWGT